MLDTPIGPRNIQKVGKTIDGGILLKINLWNKTELNTMNNKKPIPKKAKFIKLMNVANSGFIGKPLYSHSALIC